MWTLSQSKRRPMKRATTEGVPQTRCDLRTTPLCASCRTSATCASRGRVAGMEEQLQELQTLRARVVALEGERDTLQQRARDADHRAKEQEAMVQEYGRRSNATREAMGRAAMDHQRKEAESQARLNSLAEKLRQERGRYMQLQRHNQELSFSAAATAGGRHWPRRPRLAAAAAAAVAAVPTRRTCQPRRGGATRACFAALRHRPPGLQRSLALPHPPGRIPMVSAPRQQRRPSKGRTRGSAVRAGWDPHGVPGRAWERGEQ